MDVEERKRLREHEDICKAITRDADLKWRCDTRELLLLLLEDSHRTSVMLKPVQIFQELLIELAGEIVRVNDSKLNQIALRLKLIAPDNDE